MTAPADTAGSRKQRDGPDRPAHDQDPGDGAHCSTARRALITTIVAVAVIVGALALWKLKLVIALFFLAMIIAAAMRPGVEALRRRGIPRGVGVGIHYLAMLGLVALFLWFAVPRALSQIEAAVGSGPTPTARSFARRRTTRRGSSTRSLSGSRSG